MHYTRVKYQRTEKMMRFFRKIGVTISKCTIRASDCSSLVGFKSSNPLLGIFNPNPWNSTTRDEFLLICFLFFIIFQTATRSTRICLPVSKASPLSERTRKKKDFGTNFTCTMMITQLHGFFSWQLQGGLAPGLISSVLSLLLLQHSRLCLWQKEE